MAYIRNFRQTVPILDWVLFDEGISAFAYTFDVDVASTAGPGDDQGALGDLSSSDPANLFFEGAVARVVGASTYFWFEAQFIGSTSDVTLQRVIYSGTTLSKVIYNGTTVYENTPEGIVGAMSFNSFEGAAACAGTTLAFVAGGYSAVTSTRVNTVNYYNTSWTRFTPTGLTTAVNFLSGETLSSAAIFAGGDNGSTGGVNQVITYNTSATRDAVATLSPVRHNMGSSSDGTLAFFVGGISAGTRYTTVETFNSSRARTARTSIAVATTEMVGVFNGTYHCFAGGWRGSDSTNVIELYNTSGGRVTSPVVTLDVAKTQHTGTRIGTNAVFAGGISTGNFLSNSVRAVNSSGTGTTWASLSNSRHQQSAVTIGSSNQFGMFFGGSTNYSSAFNNIDVYNSSGTKLVAAAPADGKRQSAATRFGIWGLFFGGADSSLAYSTVLAYRPEMIF